MANVTNYMLQYEANQNVCIYIKNMTIQDGMLRRERVTIYIYIHNTRVRSMGPHKMQHVDGTKWTQLDALTT